MPRDRSVSGAGVVGKAEAGDVERRFVVDVKGVRSLDEVVAINAHVHLEQMSDQSYCLIVETAKERVCLFIGAARAHVTASVSWTERINRRAEAARRRENRKRAARTPRKVGRRA